MPWHLYWESSLRSLVLTFYFLRDLGGSEGGLPSWSCWSEKGIDTESLLPWPQVTELHSHLALWKGIQATSSVLGSPWHPCKGFFEEESEGEFMRALTVWSVLGWLGPMSSGQERHSADVVLPRPKPQRKHLSSGSSVYSLLPISVQIFLFQGNSQTETKPPDHIDLTVFLLRCGQMILRGALSYFRSIGVTQASKAEILNVKVMFLSLHGIKDARVPLLWWFWWRWEFLLPGVINLDSEWDGTVWTLASHHKLPETKKKWL